MGAAGGSGVASYPPGSWTVANAAYLTTKGSTTPTAFTNDLYISEDGVNVVTLSQSYTSYYYTMTTPWDISTLTYANKSLGLGNQTFGLTMNPEGTKLYTAENNTNSIRERSLSTAWDVSTATNVNTFVYTAQDTTANDVHFKPDGTKMYILGDVNDTVFEYDLSTPWSIVSATFLQSFSIAAQDNQPYSMDMRDDGRVMMVQGNQNDRIYQYDLSEPWDITSATYIGFFSVSAQETNTSGLFFRPSGSDFYVTGFTSGVGFHQYTMLP